MARLQPHVSSSGGGRGKKASAELMSTFRDGITFRLTGLARLWGLSRGGGLFWPLFS